MKRSVLFGCLSAGLLLAACRTEDISIDGFLNDINVDEGDTNMDTDVDADTGSDSDTDADMDVDADADTDVDTDTDTDSDADTDSDSDAICGDGRTEGNEGCDDGNVMPFDGCGSDCRPEPICPVGAACTSPCGDGIVSGNEECDDGNKLNGDCCSEECATESDCACDWVPVANDTMSLLVIYRDFLETSEDFEYPNQAEGDIAYSITWSTSDLVDKILTDDKKPAFIKSEATTDAQLFENGLIHSSASFDQWYRNPEDRAATVVDRLVLFDDDEDGRYVNRYENNGLKWERLNVAYDGTPVFFPMDSMGITPKESYYPAQIPPNYFGLPPGSSYDDPSCVLGEGCNPCQPIECVTGEAGDDPGGDCAPEGQTIQWYDCYEDSPRHNFHFTTETGFWFQFNAEVPQTIAFTGDDDLWVFVNGIRVIDLGGIHVPLTQSYTLDAAALGLEDGGLYEVKIFHAERETLFSTFELSLEGFSTPQTICVIV